MPLCTTSFFLLTSISSDQCSTLTEVAAVHSTPVTQEKMKHLSHDMVREQVVCEVDEQTIYVCVGYVAQRGRCTSSDEEACV